MGIAILFEQSDAENPKRPVGSRRAVVGAWLRRWRGGRGVGLHWLAAAAKAGLALLLEAAAPCLSPIVGQIIYYLTRYYSSTGSAAAALIVSIKQPPLSLSVENP
jgi:hypothetical protein